MLWLIVAVIGGLIFIAINALILNPPEVLLDFFGKRKGKSPEDSNPSD